MRPLALVLSKPVVPALAVRNLQALCGPNGCNSGKGGRRSGDCRRPGHPHRPPSWRGRLARWRAAPARRR